MPSVSTNFTAKIDKIRLQFTSNYEVSLTRETLDEFYPVTEYEVRRIVMKSPTKPDL